MYKRQALGGCSRGEGDETAQATDAASEQRVASLGLGDADTLLALGITPVTVAPWGAEGDGDPSGVGPWAEELLGEAKPEVIYNTATGLPRIPLSRSPRPTPPRSLR